MLLTAIKRSTDPYYDGYYVEARPGLLGSVLPASTSGVVITHEMAMQISAVNNCVRLLCEGLGTLPLRVLRRVPRGREKAMDHPLYRVLHDRANDEMPSLEWRETKMGHILLWGDGFSEIQRARNGEIIGLWPMSPNRVEVTRGRKGYMNDPAATPQDKYGKWYYYKFPSGEIKEFKNDQVLHIPGLSFDGFRGQSVLGFARNCLGLAHSMETFGAGYFNRGMMIGGVVETPDELGEEGQKNLHNSIISFHEGLSKAHRILILEQNAKFHEIGGKPEDAQLLASRKFEVEEIGRFFNIPLHKIKSLDKASFSNIEQQAIEYVVDALRPWLVKWEQWFNFKLLNNDPRYYVEFSIDALLRGDMKTRMDAYQVARYGGWMNGNEIRELENMNSDPRLDEYWMPANMMPAGAERQEVGDTIGRAVRRVTYNYRHIVEQAMQRVIAREIADQRKAPRTNHGPLVDVYGDEFVRFMRIVLTPPLMTLAGNIADIVREPREVGVKIEPRHVEEVVEREVAGAISKHCATSKDDLKGITDVSLAEKVFEGWDGGRSTREAREVTQVVASRVSEIIWRTIGLEPVEIEWS